MQSRQHVPKIYSLLECLRLWNQDPSYHVNLFFSSWVLSFQQEALLYACLSSPPSCTTFQMDGGMDEKGSYLERFHHKNTRNTLPSLVHFSQCLSPSEVGVGIQDHCQPSCYVQPVNSSIVLWDPIIVLDILEDTWSLNAPF